ncbi:MAG: hypothetical protein K2H86_05205 [Muribaculaceae bacterium]|nr:hypothetical protein [Muribaculaceae bacterium]
MYLSLIDTVSKIVKAYGINILSDPKFWYILSDSYSFGNEYVLKDIFKRCLNTGYISKLVAIKGNSKKTKTEINHLVNKENKLNPGKGKEYSAVLYSVAIAIGSCNKKDYYDFINPNNPHPCKNPNTSSSHNRSFYRNVIATFGSIIKNYTRILIAGILTVSISTLLYGLYLFYGWWMFFILVIMGIMQMWYCGYWFRMINNANNQKRKSDIASVGFPFIVAYCVNVLLSFFFQGSGFRWVAFNYFGDWQPKYAEGLSHVGAAEMYQFTHNTLESPSFFSILAGIIFFACPIGCAIEFCKNHSGLKLKIKYCLLSLFLMMIPEACIFIYPTIKHKTQEENFLQREANIRAQMVSLKERNDALISSRATIVKDLSFKDIKLGISWDTAIGYAKTIVESDSSSNRYANDFIEKYFYTRFRENNEVIETLTKADESYAPEDSTEYHYLTGKLLKFNTTIDNNEVSVRIFGVKDKVYAIVITPSDVSPYWSFEDYDDFVKLYKRKYGEPEIIRDRAYYDDNSYPDNTIYEWTFKNGIVRLTTEYITYLPSSFFTLANDVATKKKLEKEEEERRLKYLQFQKDSIMKATQLADSLRRLHNHKNAINEI